MRYADMRPSIIISNCDLGEFRRALGEKSYDRLRENGGLVCPCYWPSWRGDE
jgi:DNA replication protein DnaC